MHMLTIVVVISCQGGKLGNKAVRRWQTTLRSVQILLHLWAKLRIEHPKQIAALCGLMMEKHFALPVPAIFSLWQSLFPRFAWRQLWFNPHQHPASVNMTMCTFMQCLCLYICANCPCQLKRNRYTYIYNKCELTTISWSISLMLWQHYKAQLKRIVVI